MNIERRLKEILRYTGLLLILKIILYTVVVTTAERCCRASGVPDGCFGFCMTSSEDYDYMNTKVSGGNHCTNHGKAITKCRRPRVTGSSLL